MLGSGSVRIVPQVLLPREDKAEKRAAALAIWRSAGPIEGTPAEAYLRGRGIHIKLPASLRFARLSYGRGERLPCLVALVADTHDKVSGIQRTFVKEDGSGKADVPAAKLSLGRIAGAAIRLAPVAADLVVTGGLEDGLTLQQELGRAVWCATGEGNVANLDLPASVQSVTIGADNDESGEAHARRAAEAFTNQGRAVRIIRPLSGFKDFSAELQGIAA
jgi:DNA primase